MKIELTDEQVSDLRRSPARGARRPQLGDRGDGQRGVPRGSPRSAASLEGVLALLEPDGDA